MARFILSGSTLNKLLIAVVCVMACYCMQSAAMAQRVGGHPGVGGRVGGGARMSAPARVPMARPALMHGPHVVGAGPRGFGFRQGTVRIFRPRVFFGGPFVHFRVGRRFTSGWWPICGQSLGWAWSWGGGLNCNPLPFYGYGYENYVTLPSYESPEYLYGGEGRDLVWLYQKDGTMYGVTDYWLVDGQMHFSTIDDYGARANEHTIPYDDLDLQKTIDVNTRRGFRIVFRDEPWQQYLKNHPDSVPTDVPPPQKK
jgi:hypothetical protein